MNAGFPPDARCLIGVSGGRDSVVLLHRLHAAGFRALMVCHLDHALRVESAADAQFVADLAVQFNFEFVSERVDVAALAQQRKQSVETAAREARYAFFARTARERDCSRLFLAHHADDQVETFLFNLFRGSSARGLAGMSVLSERTIDGVRLSISRPMLDLWREEIDAYVVEHRLVFREDNSNADRRITRNRFRHEIIPALEQAFGRDIRRAVWRTSEILRAEDELLDGMTGTGSAQDELGVPELEVAPVALQRRRLYAWLKAHGVPSIGFAEVEAVRALLRGEVAKANLPGGWHARRRARKLFLEHPGSLSD